MTLKEQICAMFQREKVADGAAADLSNFASARAEDQDATLSAFAAEHVTKLTTEKAAIEAEISTLQSWIDR